MLEQLTAIEKDALTALESVTDSAALEQWRLKYQGGRSALTEVLKGLGKLSAEERPAAGKRANDVKQALQAAFDAKTESIKQAEMERAMQAGAVDVTLPGRPLKQGRLHPVTSTFRQLFQVWGEMGFQVYRSREVETDEYNFEFLNFPKGHPAREMQDTFYTTVPDVILRTHTSPGQIRVMREFAQMKDAHGEPPPIRVVLPGMCYRYEQVTTRSDMQFWQMEGLAVGKHITLANLKGTLADFARRMFGANVKTRFRSDHFPFTEPSAEVDVECYLCGGTGCRVCKYSGWLEILGCGMVHPVVLQYGGYDPEKYSGFAFGMGPQRISMLAHGITDIRYFLAGDLRFLEQF